MSFLRKMMTRGRVKKAAEGRLLVELSRYVPVQEIREAGDEENKKSRSESSHSYKVKKWQG